jgi:hypothetical protein
VRTTAFEIFSKPLSSNLNGWRNPVESFVFTIFSFYIWRKHGSMGPTTMKLTMLPSKPYYKIGEQI